MDMNLALRLIREVEAEGVTLELIGEQIRMERGKYLPSLLLQKVRDHKNAIIEFLRRDEKAREVGFLPLHSGEVYELQISPTTHVFIILEGDTWNALRETWRPGKLQSISQKQIVEQASFDLALLKAVHYVEAIIG